MVLTITDSLADADYIVVVTATAGLPHGAIETAEGAVAEIAARTRWFRSDVRPHGRRNGPALYERAA